MDYNDFSEETKEFMNRAMDIYSTIRDKEIVQNIRYGKEYTAYQLNKIDKKIVSLLIAGFMVDGNLKEILGEYEDIKLQDLLDFVKIDKNDINKLADDEYSTFYSKNFRLDIKNIIKETERLFDINIITPEVIIWCFKQTKINGSTVLNLFSRMYNLSYFFMDHALLNSLENYNLIEKNISKKQLLRNNENGNKQEKRPQPSTQTKSKKSITISFDAKTWSLLDEIQKKFIGQERAVKDLFYNIVNNQQLAGLDEVPDDQRSVMFVDGPSGTGKTAIIKEIANKLGIPFSHTPITSYSATGYKGGDITDILPNLLKQADGDLETAQRGIVFLDEFEKISYFGSGDLEMKKAVQDQLLHFLGGGKYSFSVGSSIWDREEIEFDTSKLTFICAGALTDLRSQKAKPKQSIGFGTNNSQKDKNEEFDYTITKKDLIKIGLKKELVNRFNTPLHTDEYSRETLIKILKESLISPLIGFKLWIELNGKKLEIDSDVYNLIADQAYELDEGARGLQTVMNNIRTHFIEEVLRGTSETIYLTGEIVQKIYKGTFGRKVRA